MEEQVDNFVNIDGLILKMRQCTKKTNFSCPYLDVYDQDKIQIGADSDLISVNNFFLPFKDCIFTI